MWVWVARYHSKKQGPNEMAHKKTRGTSFGPIPSNSRVFANATLRQGFVRKWATAAGGSKTFYQGHRSLCFCNQFVRSLRPTSHSVPALPSHIDTVTPNQSLPQFLFIRIRGPSFNSQPLSGGWEGDGRSMVHCWSPGLLVSENSPGMVYL